MKTYLMTARDGDAWLIIRAPNKKTAMKHADTITDVKPTDEWKVFGHPIEIASNDEKVVVFATRRSVDLQ